METDIKMDRQGEGSQAVAEAAENQKGPGLPEMGP